MGMDGSIMNITKTNLIGCNNLLGNTASAKSRNRPREARKKAEYMATVSLILLYFYIDASQITTRAVG